MECCVHLMIHRKNSPVHFVPNRGHYLCLYIKHASLEFICTFEEIKYTANVQCILFHTRYLIDLSTLHANTEGTYQKHLLLSDEVPLLHNYDVMS